MENQANFWSVCEVASHYGVHTNTVYKAISDGEFPNCRQLRKRGVYRIPIKDAQSWGRRRMPDPL